MKKLVLLGFLLLPFITFSQNINRSVIGTAGTYSENGNISLSWTLGESVIKTRSTEGLILNQGFQQGNLSVTTLSEREEMDFMMEIYPNPVKSKLTIETDKRGQLYQLVNLDGQVVKSGRIENREMQMDFSGLPQGMYILKINNRKTHKIIKQ
jgi:hypothetical protein